MLHLTIAFIWRDKETAKRAIEHALGERPHEADAQVDRVVAEAAKESFEQEEIHEP